MSFPWQRLKVKYSCGWVVAKSLRTWAPENRGMSRLPCKYHGFNHGFQVVRPSTVGFSPPAQTLIRLSASNGPRLSTPEGLWGLKNWLGPAKFSGAFVGGESVQQQTEMIANKASIHL